MHRSGNKGIEKKRSPEATRRRGRLGPPLRVGRLLLAVSSLAAMGTAGAVTGQAAGAPSLYSITIAEQPFNGLAATELGQVKGIFAHYGFKVTLAPVSTVAVITAEVQSGQAQLGYAVLSIMINADEQGVGVRCVAPVENKSEPIKGYPGNALVVAKDSPIKSPSQLVGKTVALPALQGPDYLSTKEAVTVAGGKWSGVKTAAIGFADMSAAVQSGEVAAADEVSPFIEEGIAAGKTRLLTDMDSYLTGDTVQCYMASNKFIAAHQTLLTRFVRAQDQSILFAAAHPSEANAEIPKVSGLPAADVKGTLPPKVFYSDDLAAASIIKYEKWQQKWGGLSGPLLPITKLAWLAPGTPMSKLLFDAGGKYTGG